MGSSHALRLEGLLQMRDAVAIELPGLFHGVTVLDGPANGCQLGLFMGDFVIQDLVVPTIIFVVCHKESYWACEAEPITSFSM